MQWFSKWGPPGNAGGKIGTKIRKVEIEKAAEKTSEILIIFLI